MLTWIMNRLRGCAHSRTTFPITMNRSKLSAPLVSSQTYVCCLGCGKEFLYDWVAMRRGEPLRSSAPRTGSALPLAGRLIGTDVRQRSY